MDSSCRFVVGALASLVFAVTSCGTSSESPQSLAQTMVAQTAVAQSAYNIAQTMVAQTAVAQQPPPTPFTPVPTVIAGPFTYSDDMTRESNAWFECEFCTWTSEGLVMGPYPTSLYNKLLMAVCRTCGQALNYRMAVDVTYVDGNTERGYGLVLRDTQEHLTVLGISPGQYVMVAKLERAKEEWQFLTQWTLTGTLKPGKSKNHLEVLVDSTQSGKAIVTVMINGRTPLVIEGQPAEVGWGGLYLGGHAVSVRFENFEFEELKPFGERITGGQPW